MISIDESLFQLDIQSVNDLAIVTDMSESLNTSSDQPASGALTPGKIATQLSQLDLPNPFGLTTNGTKDNKTTPSSVPAINADSPTRPRRQSNADDVARQLSNMKLPDPERINQHVDHRRRESQSEQLSAKLAGMKFPQPERLEQATHRGETSEQLATRLAGMDFPQPERIFGGPDDVKGGVSAADWDKIKLGAEYDVPEAVRRGSVSGITSPVVDSGSSFNGHEGKQSAPA